MGAVLVVLLCSLLGGAAASQPFNSPTYLCSGDSSTRVYSINSTAQIRRPHFFPCEVGQQRDHFVELQVLKAFVEHDVHNSLSCETINFLNRGPSSAVGYVGGSIYPATGNVGCIDAKQNAAKAAFFGDLIRGGGSKCSAVRPSIRKAFDCFMRGGAFQPPPPQMNPQWQIVCPNGIGLPVTGFGCCTGSESAYGNPTAFGNILDYGVKNALASSVVSRDLEEIARFLDYKLHVYCTGAKPHRLVNTARV